MRGEKLDDMTGVLNTARQPLQVVFRAAAGRKTAANKSDLHLS
jgi:hypothetical protein